MSSTKSTTEYWKKCETVQILSGKRERLPSKKQQAIQEDDGTTSPNTTTKTTSKRKSINKDAPLKQKKSKKKKKAKSKKQIGTAAVSIGEREVDTEAAVVGASMRQGEVAVGDRVAEADGAMSFVVDAEVAKEGAVMEDENTNTRAASAIDEDCIDLEAFELELK